MLLDLLRIPYVPFPVRAVVPDGGAVIPSFRLPSMNSYLHVVPSQPTKRERDHLAFLAEGALHSEGGEEVHIAYGDMGRYRIEPVFARDIADLLGIGEALRAGFGETLAQCSFCGRFSFARAGEFVRCFPNGPTYCEEWLLFCQQLDIDASTVSNADPRDGFCWPRHSPMRDLALEAAKAIDFSDPTWESRVSDLELSINTLWENRIFATNSERRATVDMIKRYVAGATSDVSFRQTWLSPTIDENIKLIDKFGLPRPKRHEQYIMSKLPIM